MAPHLSIGLRWRIVALKIDSGWSYRRIHRHLRVSIAAVQRTVRVYTETGNVEDLPRSGRPRATDAEDDAYVVEPSL